MSTYDYLHYFIHDVITHLGVPREEADCEEKDSKIHLRVKTGGYNFELEAWTDPEDRIHWKWNIPELDEIDHGDFKPKYKDDEDEEETTLGIFCVAQGIAQHVDEAIYQKEKRDAKNEMKILFDRLRTIVPKDLRADDHSDQLRRIIGHFEALRNHP